MMTIKTVAMVTVPIIKVHAAKTTVIKMIIIMRDGMLFGHIGSLISWAWGEQAAVAGGSLLGSSGFP
jgi:hypothetical protein